MIPGLYIVSTPIGNLEDITIRAINTLRDVDIILCEDTRKTGNLLSHYQIKAKKISYNEYNRGERIPEVIKSIKTGKKVALVCNSGTPCISDPGYKLVQEVIKQNLYFTSIPGPSAVLTGLLLSGAPPDRFIFAGFLPKKGGKRKNILKGFKEEVRTGIFFESPKRLRKTLIEMKETIGERRVSVVKEMTKIYEDVLRGDISEILEMLQGQPKGEFIIVLWGKD